MNTQLTSAADERICASSVAVYFESLRVPVLTYQQTVEKKRLKIALPNIACDTDSSSALGASDLYEWLGAVANGIDWYDVQQCRRVSSVFIVSGSITQVDYIYAYTVPMKLNYD